MAKATAVPDTYVVEQHGGIGGMWHLAVAIDPDDPYGSWKKLPAVVYFEGREYGKTGYNSDTNLAYFSTGAKIARKGN